MEFKGNWKHRVSGLLAVAILMSSMPSYGAARFTDVPEKHWAYSHVENMAKLGYLQGKGEGKFDPTGNMTFMEALAAFSRLTKPTSTDKANALREYEWLLKELKITQAWEKEAVSLSLYKDIVTENDVRRAKPIYHEPIQKVAASVLLAKAIGLEQKAASLNVIFLDYDDVTDIAEKDRRYVKVLLDSNILDKNGDGTGKFYPKQALRREIMATLMNKANDYIIKNPINKNNTNNNSNNNSTNNNNTTNTGNNNNTTNNSNNTQEYVKPSGIKETMTTKVERVTKEIGREFLVVKTNAGKEVSFVIDKDTDIRLDGKKSKVSDLTKGLEVIIKYDSNTKDLYSITAEFEKEDFEGNILSINSRDVKLEYNDDGKIRTKTFDVDTNAKVTREGSSTSYSNIRKGDVVTIKSVNGKITELNAKASKIDIKGEVEKIDEVRNSKHNEQELTVKTSNKEEYKIIVDSDSRIERNGKNARPDTIRETDKVEITAEYDIDRKAYWADRLYADVVSEKVKGYVTQITNRLTKNPLITVRLKNENKEEKYELLPDAYIKVDGKTSKTLPSNPGYEVELYIEGKTDIVEAYVNTLTMETSLFGKVESIDTRDDYVEIRLSNLKYGDREIVRVYIDDDTEIIDKYFSKIKFRSLYKGDYINVVGVYKGANFIANTIQLRD